MHPTSERALTVFAVLAADAIGTDTAVAGRVTDAAVHAEGGVGVALLDGAVARVGVQTPGVLTVTVRV